MKISIIIPTFGREKEVITRTIDSIFKSEDDLNIIQDIIVIDQNPSPLPLGLNYSQTTIKDKRLNVVELNRSQSPSYDLPPATDLPVVHITGGQPSVTKAKNFGVKSCKGEYLVFLDDDVVLQKNCLKEHLGAFVSNDKASFIGGREIVHPKILERSKFRELLIKIFHLFSSQSKDVNYKVNGEYIGKIKSNSLMFSQFDITTDQNPLIDGARGCNWSTSKQNVLKAGMFDENFLGTALREETDLYLRIGKLSGPGIFNSKACVIHMRQLGGCNNISKSLATLNSKFGNELYFQRKHFSHVSPFYFALRTLPTALESCKSSFGLSVVTWIKFVFKFMTSKNQQAQEDF
tara:strand:- start:77998 stop:79041 length:1044 start_codon:yes stop_codon:yes gene_type:complete